LAGSGTADANVKKESDAFLNKEGYSSYETISRRYNLFPIYYEYIVQFKHPQEQHPAQLQAVQIIVHRSTVVLRPDENKDHE
jgi:hypothetical protein